MTKKFYVSWDNLQRSPSSGSPSTARIPVSEIIAVSRGGLVPAAQMARELGIRFVDTHLHLQL